MHPASNLRPKQVLDPLLRPSDLVAANEGVEEPRPFEGVVARIRPQFWIPLAGFPCEDGEPAFRIAFITLDGPLDAHAHEGVPARGREQLRTPQPYIVHAADLQEGRALKPHLVVEKNVGQQVLLGVPPGKAPDVAVLVYIEIGKIYHPFNKPHGRASLWNDVRSREAWQPPLRAHRQTRT